MKVILNFINKLFAKRQAGNEVMRLKGDNPFAATEVVLFFELGKKSGIEI
jgi:spore coat polysaccharide biosynthesis protein SpsF (cytidylyltransferase family)